MKSRAVATIGAAMMAAALLTGCGTSQQGCPQGAVAADGPAIGLASFPMKGGGGGGGGHSSGGGAHSSGEGSSSGSRGSAGGTAARGAVGSWGSRAPATSVGPRLAPGRPSEPGMVVTQPIPMFPYYLYAHSSGQQACQR